MARTFPADPTSVPAARSFIRETLAPEPGSVQAAAELMVSELATNCVRHARRGFALEVALAPAEVRVEVSDPDPGRPVQRGPEPLDPFGRGLQIVGLLSRDWGVCDRDPVGKTVWFTLPRTGAPGGPGSEQPRL